MCLWERRNPWRPGRWRRGSRPGWRSSPCRTQTEGSWWCWPSSEAANWELRIKQVGKPVWHYQFDSRGSPHPTCWSSRCATCQGRWSSCCPPARPRNRRSTWRQVGLCSAASPRWIWTGSPHMYAPPPWGDADKVFQQPVGGPRRLAWMLLLPPVLVRKTILVSVLLLKEAIWLVPLALVESSLVRCTSFSLSFFLSGFFLWSSTSSGSICRNKNKKNLESTQQLKRPSF